MHGGKLDLGQSPWYHIRARIFKQVQPLVITTQQHQCSNLAIGYDCLKSFTQCTHPGVYVCYYEESDFCSLLYCMTSWSILPKYYCTGLVYYIIILLYYYQLWYYDITMFVIHQDEDHVVLIKTAGAQIVSRTVLRYTVLQCTPYGPSTLASVSLVYYWFISWKAPQNTTRRFAFIFQMIISFFHFPHRHVLYSYLTINTTQAFK